MKSKITETPQPDKGITFPCLMQALNMGESTFVVLFSDLTRGTVVQSKYPFYKIGHYCSSWVKCNDKDHWIPFDEPVTISNE